MTENGSFWDVHSGNDRTTGLDPDREMARWTRPDVILVATDLSDLDRLMPYAMEQAEATGARLLVLHALALAASFAADAAGMPYYDSTSALDSATRRLEPWCAHARLLGVACECLVREGNAAQQIISAARQFRVDRLIVGTRSRGKLGKLLLGSVAEQVLRSVTLPVITVGPEAHLKVATGAEKRTVVHATALREASRPSAVLACRIAASQGSRLLLLHVLPPTHGDESGERSGTSGQAARMDSAALLALQFLAAEVRAECGVEVEAHVVHGHPAIEILAEAAGRDARLIVLGARKRSLMGELTRDRTIYQVLAHARCPVLTLREAASANPAVEIGELAGRRGD